MKIKILTPLPVDERIRPQVGGVYDVIREVKGEETLYFVEVNGEEVGVFASFRRGECCVVEEEKAPADAGTSNADAQ